MVNPNLIPKSVVRSDGVLTTVHVKPDVATDARKIPSVTPAVSAAGSKSTEPRLLAGVPVPEVSFDKLYHVGELDESKKKGWSLEGSGMSVSRHPLAWRKIAWLQGDIHEFDVKDNRFLDWHELSDEQKDEITAWGVEKGYLKPTTLYSIRYWDDELDYEVTMTFQTEEEAAEEAENYGEEYEAFEGHLATETFTEGAYIGTPTNFDQVIACAWVNEEATEFDGVWWEDNLDTSRDSAPRGVLAGNKIAEWVASSRVVHESNTGEADDDYADYNYEDGEWIS